jgi:hypothetical protein
MNPEDAKVGLVVSAIAVGAYVLGWLISSVCKTVITKTIHNNNVADLTEQGYEISKGECQGKEYFDVGILKPVNAHRRVGYLNPDGKQLDSPFYFSNIEDARRAVWCARKQKLKT